MAIISTLDPRRSIDLRGVLANILANTIFASGIIDGKSLSLARSATQQAAVAITGIRRVASTTPIFLVGHTFAHPTAVLLCHP